MKSGSHRAWLAHWSEQLVGAIKDAVAHPTDAIEDHRMFYAVHCARIAYGRALKVNPGLKEQNMKAVQSMTAKKSRKNANAKPAMAPTLNEATHASAENFDGKAADSACIPETPAISSDQSAMTPNQTTGEANGPTPTQEKRKVTLTLKGLDKSGRNAVYTGAAISLRFPIGAFENKTPPANLDMGGVAGPKEKGKPRSQMTKEEQKAARAAQPKLTLAEKVAKAEERLAAQRAKLAAQQTAPAAAAQPAL